MSLRAGIVAVLLLASSTSMAAAQQTWLPPRQYYSPSWQFDGISPMYGPRYKCWYYWKLPNQDVYKRYEVLYYSKFNNYVHIWDAEAGKFLWKSTTYHHPNYNYWVNQWSASNGPKDPVDTSFDPNAPATPGNSGLTLPRPPCPPDDSSPGGNGTPVPAPPEP